MKKNILGAMFDVRPIKESGGLDFEKAIKPQVELNLRSAEAPLLPKVHHNFDNLFDSDATLTALPETKRYIKPKSIAVAKNPVFKSQSSSDVERSDDELRAVATAALRVSEAVTTASRSHKEKLLQELGEMISSPMNVTAEVVKFGGRVHFNTSKKPAPKTVDHFSDWLATNPSPEKVVPAESESKVTDPVYNWWTNIPKIEQEPTLAVIDTPTSFDVERSDDELEAVTTAPTVASWRRPWPASGGDTAKLRDYVAGGKSYNSVHSKSRSKIRFRMPTNLFGRRAWVAGMAIALVFVGFKLLSQSETNIKNNVVQNGKNAVANLMDARERLLGFDFVSAANDFALAQDDFSKAGSKLDKVGAVFAPVFAHIPGLNKLTAATNLIIAGQNISQAGGELSLALNDLSKINISSFINPSAGQAGVENSEARQSLYEFLQALKDVLASSQNKVTKASGLLTSVNESILPEDKRDLFVLFKDKLPELAEFFDKSNDYLDTLMNLVGQKGTKTYLVLLQNNTELRATGGFPGSYALISIQDGYIKEIKIDDSYNPDGQLRNNLIPPKPLQHITPTWGMRDANWFADFPTSAQKVMNSYSKSTGIVVDGVLTLTPDVITDILSIIGPIDMPEYNLTLNADNFLPQIQEEVEYGDDSRAGKPKKILMDFQPKFLAKLGQQDKEHLVKISQALLTAFQQKRILGYFSNADAEKLAITKNFGGEIKNTKGDYLQVNISNIKGFKTDLVTKTAIDLATSIDTQGTAEHKLAITRTHNGGNLDQKFYNQPNPAYIRVYAPRGAEFESITGNTWTTYEPLVDYSQSIFKPDPDLAAIEEGTSNPVFSVDVFEESGKTVFGFWLVINPGKSKTVILKYKVPHIYTGNEYDLYVQKQSGTQGITFNSTINFPGGNKFTGFLPADLKLTESVATLTTNLDLDIPIIIQTR